MATIVKSTTNTTTIDMVTSVHPEYRRMISLWRFLRDSYVGGLDYQEGQYLTRYQFESEEEYRNRILQTPIDNHCKSVVHTFNSFIFQQPIKREFGTIGANPGLEPFLEDADLEGRSLDAVMREVNIQSSIYGSCWLVIDKPATNVATRAEELQQEIRPYVSAFTPENVLDWQFTRKPNGYYELSYLKVLEADDFRYRSEESTVVTREYFTDRIEVRVYSGTTKSGETVETYPNPLGRVPAVCVYASRSGVRGVGVSDIQDVATQQRAIYDELSEIDQLIRLSNHPSLVSTIDVQASAGAGARIIMPDNMDSNLRPYLLQPSAQNLEGIMNSIQKKIEAIDRMANMGSSRGNRAITLSAVAMDTEFRQLNVRLSEKADNLEYAEENMWRIWCEWQGLVWDGEVNYPNTFNMRDKVQDLNLAKLSRELDPDNPYVMRAIRETIADVICEDGHLQELIEYWQPPLEAPAVNRIEGRTYPDGEEIPVELPGAYQLATGAEQCGNCEYYKMNRAAEGAGYCTRFNGSAVREIYWCAKWNAKEKSSGPE